MRAFIGMDDGAARHAILDDGDTIGLTLGDERQDAAFALDQCNNHSAVCVLVLGQSAVLTVLFAVLWANMAAEVGTMITSVDAVHDQKDPQDLLRRLHGALRPGGTYLMQDIGGSAHLEKNIGFPMAALLYAISCAHCTPVSLGQGGLGLGTMWGWETAQGMLEDSGFASIERQVLPHDPMNVWFVSKKAAGHA